MARSLRNGAARSRGAVLVMVLVCLGLAATLTAILLQQLVAEQRQLRQSEDRAEAFWLLESAADRARAQLGRSADYGGEVWELAPPQLDNGRTARVTIDVRAAGERRGGEIHVQVVLQADQGPIRQSGTIPIPQTNPGDG